MKYILISLGLMALETLFAVAGFFAFAHAMCGHSFACLGP